jgi:glutamine synthetase
VAKELFEKYEVLSERELLSRYEVYQHTYDRTVGIEGECALTMAKTVISPAALCYERQLAETVSAIKAAGAGDAKGVKELLGSVAAGTEKMMRDIKKLESAVKADEADAIISAMTELRASVDNLESLVPHSMWPLPSYVEMMFMM